MLNFCIKLVLQLIMLINLGLYFASGDSCWGVLVFVIFFFYHALRRSLDLLEVVDANVHFIDFELLSYFAAFFRARVGTTTVISTIDTGTKR